MELDQYVALHGKHVSLHLDNRHHQCRDSKGSVDVEFNGHTLSAGYSLCTKGLQYQPNQLLSQQFAHEESIAFGQVVDQLGMGVSLTLRPYVQFEQPVYDQAAAFIRKHFGGAPYLAIHWRRTDFLAVRQSQPGVLQAPEALIRHARQLMKAHGLQRVYLATDCDDERELKIVTDALSPLRYMPGSTHQRSLKLVERVRAANVEIAICSMANFFLGTRTSSFTLAITEEREAIFGQPPETGSEMGANVPKDEL